MIIVESKRKKLETLKKKYPDAIIHDVTSHAEDEFIKFSPFYPHYGIPVPFSPGVTSASVEGIWQGLKVFYKVDVVRNCFTNDTMKDLKRTTRKYGPMKGHRKGVNGTEFLDYLTARREIYVPSYKWMLEHRVSNLVEKLREESKTHTVLLLDYDTNEDINDTSSPMSHAGLIKAYIEGRI